MTTKMIGVKELRQNMAKFLNEAVDKKQRLIILKRNKPIFELKPLSEEESTLEGLVADVKKGMDDMNSNEVYSHEEIKSMFGLV